MARITLPQVDEPFEPLDPVTREPLIRRYRPLPHGGMVQDDDGPYVRVEDAQALAALALALRQFVTGGVQ